MTRNLYIAAYDIREPTRLKTMRRLLRDFASGGQKSVFECWLSTSEKNRLLQLSEQEVQPEDAFLLVQLRVKHTVYRLGKASAIQNDNFLYIG